MCRIGLEENNTKVQQTIMMILRNYSTFVTASTACSVFSYRPVLFFCTMSAPQEQLIEMPTAAIFCYMRLH